MTDPAGNEWTYQYDWAGQQIEAVDPDSGTTTTTYTILGQVHTRTNGNGDTLRYTYDKLGRTTELIDDATGVARATWTFDTAEDTNGTRLLGPLGTATRHTGDGDYLTITDTYDDAYRPLSVTTELPDDPALLDFADNEYTTQYAYTADGQISQTKLPAVTTDAGTTVLGAETITTRYDSAGVASWMGGGFGWGTYVAKSETNLDGKPRLLDLGNTYGATITYDWDASTNRLSSIALDRERVNGSELNLQYAYDPAGNITSIVDAPTNTTAAAGFTEAQCFNYDGLRRLTDAWATPSTACGPANQVTQANIGGPAAYWHEYAYDQIGNRTSLTEHTPAGAKVTENTHGDPDEGQGPHQIVETITTRPGGPTLATGYTWDAAGNQTSRAEDGELNELTWDIEGELTSITGGDADVDNVYDADGNRLIRTDDNGVTVYLPGGQELHAAEYGTVSATRWYTFAGTTVAVRTGKGLAGVQSVVTNHQGTPIARIANTDFAAGVTRAYTDPYGNARGSDVATVDGRGFLAAPVDPGGLVRLGARYYDPRSGTFISVDPLLDSTLPAQFNAYVYSGNNPVTWSDPSGLVWRMDGEHPRGAYDLNAASRGGISMPVTSTTKSLDDVSGSGSNSPNGSSPVGSVRVSV